MITDEMLKQAADKAMIQLNESLPAPDVCTHKYSPEFERKMRKITRYVSHPILYRTLQVAASFILVLSLGFGSILVVSVQAREAVFTWIKAICENSYVYFSNTETPPSNMEYEPSFVPEGYVLDSKLEPPDGGTYIFRNQEDRVLTFQYINTADSSALLIEKDENNAKQVIVNGLPADAYIADDLEEDNVIVWENNDILFCISGNLSEDELIQIANSVKATKSKN